MKSPSFFSEPNIQYLYQVLEEIGESQLLIPRFQRPLIWEVDQRLELLRSVRDGIPCGAIMVWRTTAEIKCYNHIGPFKLSPQKQSNWQYLMDGVQRLSTLYAALHALKGLDSPEAADFDEEAGTDDLTFYYDLESEEFYTADQFDDQPSMLPLRILLESVALLGFQRQLQGDEADRWIRNADALAKSFRLYKIPIIPIVTESLEMATRTFQLINRQGTKMSDLHMVHTLTFSQRFDLLSRIEGLREENLRTLGWSEIDGDWILKALEAAFGLDLGKRNTKKLSEMLKEAPEILKQTAGHLESAINFLREQCGVPSPYMVPYSSHAILLAEAFRVMTDPTEAVRSLLKSWFWLTTIGGSFAGISGSRLSRVTDDIREMVIDEEPAWSFSREFSYRPLPPKVDFKAVRTKALALRLAARQCFDEGKTGQQLLVEYRNRALVHLLPASHVSKSRYSSPGNRVLADGETLKRLRAGLLDGGEVSEELWERHLICQSARDRLSDSGDAFIDQRVKDLEAEERKFIRPHAERFGFIVD